MSIQEGRRVGQKRRAKFAEMRDQPAVTKDGVKIELMVNAGLEADGKRTDHRPQQPRLVRAQGQAGVLHQCGERQDHAQRQQRRQTDSAG